MSYELQAFEKGKRGKLHRIKALTIPSDDPHTMAVEYWRLTHLSHTKYIIRVLDVSAGRGGLAPVVSYEELVRRAGSILAGGVLQG
jgi:hypothetical protein